MSENEKKLRAWVDDAVGSYPGIHAAGVALLDALIAEHRAEAEHLKKDKESLCLCYEAAKQREGALRDRLHECKAGQDADRERYATALEEQMAETATARDAALEEAALYFKDSEPGTTWGVNEAVSEMRALKSRPARRYVDVEKVCQAIRDTRRESADMLEADERDFLRRLGVDLDAKGATSTRTEHDANGFITAKRLCRGCEHRLHQPGACAAPVCVCRGDYQVKVSP